MIPQPTSITPSPKSSNLPLRRTGALRGSILIASFAAAALLATLPVSGQPTPPKPVDPTTIEAPQPRPPAKTPSTVVGMLSGLFLAFVVLAVNFIPSKRGHQD